MAITPINELHAFYMQMKEQLQIKNTELEEAHNIIDDMNNHARKFSRFYDGGHINEIRYAQIKKELKSVFRYYEGQINKLNKLIPDIQDYIKEYEIEFGISKVESKTSSYR